MIKSITIDVAPDGTINIEGKNFEGKQCDEKMKAFEDGLGAVKARKDLPEYHRAVTTTQKLRQ